MAIPISYNVRNLKLRKGPVSYTHLDVYKRQPLPVVDGNPQQMFAIAEALHQSL